MRHGSLFSGIGGFDLASEWMGWENIFQVEWDKYCQKVLAKNFPKVKRYEDIKQFDGTKYRGSVDIITGGFPCQPFSQAGKRKGTEDDRYLWSEMLRVIREIKPSFVVGENVAGLLTMENGKTLDKILTDLEDEGYQVESFIIPASAIGAQHRRERIWIVAYSGCRIKRKCSNRIEVFIRRNSSKRSTNKISRSDNDGREGNVTNATNARTKSMYKPEDISSKKQWEVEPNVGRVANGVPSRVDRLKGLGNAIVPQVAYEIFKAIENLKSHYE